MTQCWTQFNWLLWVVEFVAYFVSLVLSSRQSTILYQFLFDYFEKCEMNKMKTENWIFRGGTQTHTHTHIWWLRSQNTRFALGINLFTFIFNQAALPFAQQTNRKTILSPFLLDSFRWIRYDGKLHDIDEQSNYYEFKSR